VSSYDADYTYFIYAEYFIKLHIKIIVVQSISYRNSVLHKGR